jgi:flavin reductase (DIM6/NTAB) family NADH-FMN oxidoreductase RutF/DNA-binding IclR family transcriptional regulator
MTSDSQIDSRELRNTLSSFVTGVTIITTIDGEGKPHGLTANSFSSVSLDPPLVLWSQALKAPSHSVFRNAERFSISILAQDQIELSNKFSRGGQPKFEGVRLKEGLGGIPLIEGCSATLECKRIATYPGGDHLVFLGEVERIERSGRPPLGFYGGRYVVPLPHDQSAGPDASMAETIAALQAQRIATKAIIELSDRFDRTVGIGVWGNLGPTMVRWEESKNPVTTNLRTGFVLPTLKSATGLLFSAYLPKETVIAALKAEFSLLDLPRGAALSALEQVEPTLDLIRENEIAILPRTTAFQSVYGTSISAISCPVFDRTGRIVLALTVVAEPATSADDDIDFREALSHCAREISAVLGSPNSVS